MMKLIKNNKNIFWGITILIAAFTFSKTFSAKVDEEKVSQVESELTKVPVIHIRSTLQSVETSVIVRVEAQQKIGLFAEVSGILEIGDKPLLSGTPFKKDDAIVKINSNQFRADLKAQKSSFMAKLVSLLANIKFDFPENYKQWSDYLASIDVDKSLGELPEYGTTKESLFFIANGIEESYYQIKSQEEILTKYTLRAPFNGVLTDVMFKQGTMASPGQSIATFINNVNYDLIIDITKAQSKWVDIHDKIVLKNGATARINRLDDRINPNTQTIKYYASLNNSALRDDDLMSGKIISRKQVAGCEIDRKFINDDNSIYVSKKGIVKKIIIETINSREGRTLISGFSGNLTLITKTEGLVEGQRIEPINQ